VALPPTIPTSFVPKQPVTTSAKHRTSGANPFLALAYLITGIVVIGAFAVFGYQVYLEGVAKKKANDVIVAQNAIDQATVTEFIRLRDRFVEAKSILNNHVALSQVFDSLEKLTLVGVRLGGFQITVSEDRAAMLEVSGSARTFNTLAAQSAEFATDKRYKRAIFSGIAGNPKDNSVSFSLSAELDPSLITVDAAKAGERAVEPAQPIVPVVPAATTTAPKAASTTP
jgi:hypothetical protein